MGMVEIDTGHGCIEMDMDADEFGYEDVHCPGIWTLAAVDSDWVQSARMMHATWYALYSHQRANKPKDFQNPGKQFPQFSGYTNPKVIVALSYIVI